MCSHREDAYAQAAVSPLPHSEAAQDCVVLLPLYAGMSVEEQLAVAVALRESSVPVGRAMVEAA